MQQRYRAPLAPHQMRPAPTLTQTPVESQGPNLLPYLARQALGLAQAPKMMGQFARGILEPAYRGAEAHLTGQIPLDGSRDAAGARGAMDAVGGAGLLSPIMGRAGLALASSTKPAAGIRAYHGSPHDFDKFKMSQMGTGEGAQAYGHGLYFAESPGVAKSYQETLAKKINRRPFQPPKDDNPFSGAEILEEDPTRPGRLYEVNIKADPDDFLDWDKAIKEQPAHIRKRFTDAIMPKDDPSEEGRLLRELLGDEGGPAALGLFDKSSGAQAYNTAAASQGGGREIAAQMRKAGIPGIKYLDQGSRFTPNNLPDNPIANEARRFLTQANGDPDKARSLFSDSNPVQRWAANEREEISKVIAAAGRKPTYNYVVFDEDLIDITKKMGLALPLPPQFKDSGGVAISEDDLKKVKARASKGSQYSGLLKDIY